MMGFKNFRVTPQAKRIGLVLAIVLVAGLLGYWVFLYRAPDQGTDRVVAPTATPVESSPGVTTPGPILDHAETVPASGTTMSIAVPDGELRIIAGGPICVDGKCFREGETRGAVVAMLPRATPYNVTGLITNGNWLGFYTRFDGTDKYVQALVEERVASMHKAGGCAGGRGCATVHVLIVGAAGIVNEYVSTDKPLPSGG